MTTSHVPHQRGSQVQTLPMIPEEPPVPEPGMIWIGDLATRLLGKLDRFKYTPLNTPSLVAMQDVVDREFRTLTQFGVVCYTKEDLRIEGARVRVAKDDPSAIELTWLIEHKTVQLK